MPYGIRIFDRAVEDLERLLEEIPAHRRDGILEAIDAELNRFADLPTKQRPPDLTLPLRFAADGVYYRWLFSWRYEQTEKTIDVLAFGRDPTTIL